MACLKLVLDSKLITILIFGLCWCSASFRDVISIVVGESLVFAWKCSSLIIRLYGSDGYYLNILIFFLAFFLASCSASRVLKVFMS